MSSPLLLAPLIVFGTVIAFLVPVISRLIRRRHWSEVTEDWLESFTPVTYQPMELLLAEEDFEFLLRQPGFESSIGKKLRKDRVRIFRQYLHRLIADFDRLHVYARYRLSRSQEDHSVLLLRLVWLRIRFSATVFRLELSLFLAHFGFQPRLVGQALSQLDEMFICLRSVSPAR